MAQYRERIKTIDGSKQKAITATVDIPANYPHPTKARSISETFSTKPAAREWAKRTADEIKAQTWRDPRLAGPGPLPVPTLAAVMKQYMYDVTSQKEDPANERKERRLLERLSKVAFAQKAITDVTKFDIAGYVETRTRQGKSGNTIHNEVNTYSMVFRKAVHTWGYATVNPVELLRAGDGKALPKRPPGRERRFVAGEEDAMRVALAAGLDGLQMVAVLELALATGARLSEILKFRVEWRHKNEIWLPKTKNGKRRVVILSKAAVAALEALPARKAGTYLKVSVDDVESRWQTARSRAVAAMIEAAEATGGNAAAIRVLDPLHIHDLRHEALSRLIVACQGNLKVLMLQSGHSSVSQLMRYINPTVDDQRAMIERYETMLEASKA